MKKLLLLAVSLVLAVTASASTLSLNYLDIVKAATGGENRNVSLQKYTPVSISGFSIGFTTATNYKTSNKYITLSALSEVNIVAPEGGTISQVVLKLTSNTMTTGVSANVGTAAYDSEAKTITWTGSSNSVDITNKGVSYLTDMEITYTAELPVSEMPEFTPAPGKYAGPMDVTITAAPGAKIYYNIDSKEDPTVESTLYEGPVTLQPKAFGTHTIKAIAVEEGKDPSSVRSGDYEVVFGQQVNNIREFLNMNRSQFGSGQISTGTLYTFNCNCTVVYQNGKILFIEDGTGSLQVSGDLGRKYEPGDVITKFSGNFQSIKFGTPALFAMAASFEAPVSHSEYTWKEGTANDVVLANLNDAYVFTNVYVDQLPGAETPGSYRIARFANGQEVTLFAGFTNTNAVETVISMPKDPGYYTVYGFVNQETSSGASGPDTQLYFIPCKFEASEMLTTDVPAFVNPSGTYVDQVELAFEAVAGTQVYYTLDGSNPSTESTLYTEPVTLRVPTTVKAIAVAEGKLPSLIVTAEYNVTITPTTEAPVFTPAAGKYQDKVEVTIASEDNAAIYYTIDGTEPTLSSTLYTAPLEITASTTVKAIAAAEGKKLSSVVTALYEITSNAVSAAPVITPSSGDYLEKVNVTITAPEGVSIYYTLDGTVPTTESTLYTEPFTISENTTVKAIGVEEGKEASAVVEASYVIIGSGISTILTDAVSAGAELYDLNGRRVNAANAAAGLYILRQGNNVVKVLVK